MLRHGIRTKAIRGDDVALALDRGQSVNPRARLNKAAAFLDNRGMPAAERTSYCLVCDRVVLWKTWRVWEKHLESAEHRECVISPRPIPLERLRVADLDEQNYGLAAGESVVFRRPDGLWIGTAVPEAGISLRLEAKQRQIAIDRLRKQLPDEAPPTKQLCLRCRLLLDPLLLGYHNTSRLHRSNEEPSLEAEPPPRARVADEPFGLPPTTAPAPSPQLTIGMEPIVVTAADAARLLGISRSTVANLARQGTIPVLRIGSRVLVPVAALRDWVEGRLKEDAERYAAPWARVRDYARFQAAPSTGRRRRGGRFTQFG
jgi:excisionase family DNA binding protein